MDATTGCAAPGADVTNAFFPFPHGGTRMDLSIHGKACGA